MRALNAQHTPQGDLSLIYAYAKIMDPESVVREGEANSVSQSDTIAGRAIARLNKELGAGGTFSSEARRNLLLEMRNAVGVLNAEYIQARQMYGEMAKGYGLSPQEAIGPHKGLPFSKADAKFTGSTEPERDFYGNITKPGRPILSARPGGIPVPQSTLPPSEGRRVVDPTGADEFSTARDKEFAAAAQAAFSRGATRQDMDAIASRYGAAPFGADLDQAIEGRARGARTQFSTPATGRKEESLTGKIAATPIGGVIVGGLNGLTMGGLDEVGAAGASVLNGSSFSDNLADLNSRKQAIQDENPWPYAIGGISGALMSGGTLGTLSFGSKLPFLSDVGLGAAGGALEENDDRLRGATIGGVLAGGIGTGLRGVSSIPGRPGGVDLPISRAAERAGPRSLLGRLAEARDLGVPMALADADPILTRLAGSAARLSPEAESYAIGGLLPRSRGQIDRFGQAIERDLGPLANPMEQSDMLLQQARTNAAPLYERAYEAPVIGTPDIDAILNTPFGRQSLSKARNIAANDRRDPQAMGFRLDENGNVSLDPTVNIGSDEAGNLTTFQNPLQQRGYTMQALDQTKQGMDDVLEQYRNPVTGRLDLTPAGRAENGVRADFLTALDQQNPAYAEARRAYAGPMELRDALAAGRDAVKQTPREVEAIGNRMSPAEMDQMRLGYRVGLNDRANDMRFSSNPFEGTLGTPAAEQRLTSVYGLDNPGVIRLLRQRDLERQLAGTTNDILGNSKTAKRLQADESFMGGIPGGIIDVGADIAVGNMPLGSAVRAFGARSISDRLRIGAMRNAERVASDMGPILFNTDTPMVIDELSGILSRTANYRGQQRLVQPIAGTTGGIIGGVIPGYLPSGN